jgi:hypothetical protein
VKQRAEAALALLVDRACALHGPHRAFEFASPWFRNDEAAAYVGRVHRCGCPNLPAFYEWKRRHGIVSRAGGLVAKRDLDRILEQRKA